MLRLGEESTKSPLTGFRITDDGVGFTDANYDSFCTSDSMFKHDLGGRGVGRFTWLKAFKKVHIDSIYRDDGGALRQRRFFFSEVGINNLEDKKYVGNRLAGTVLTLDGIESRYLQHIPKKLDTIGQRLVDHCFEAIRAARCPVSVEVNDGDDSFNVSNEVQSMFATAQCDETEIAGAKFRVTHLRVTSPEVNGHRLTFLANKREVQSDMLAQNIPLLRAKLEDEDGQFWWLSLVESEVLDEAVSSERDAFLFPENADPLFPNQISLQLVRKELKPIILKRIDSYLVPIKERAAEQVNRYVQDRAPEYRHLVRRPELLESLPPDLPEERLDAELHRLSYMVEAEFREMGNRVLHSDQVDNSTYEEFLSEANALGKANLAKYIVHRRVMLDLFKRALARGPDGSYELEETVHKIIFPLRTTSDDVPYEKLNLWMIDERLAYHQYLASDKELRSFEVIDSEDRQRPDLIIFNSPFAFADQQSPFGSIVIVEFKRPARDDYTDGENPIAQVYEYIRKVRAGTAKDRAGRPLNVGDFVPFYCYIVCDLTPRMRIVAQNHSLTETPDAQGFFGFNTILRAYVEIITMDKLLSDAEKRNRVLFEKLRLPK
jgi:hypothetical protein